MFFINPVAFENIENDDVFTALYAIGSILEDASLDPLQARAEIEDVFRAAGLASSLSPTSN